MGSYTQATLFKRWDTPGQNIWWPINWHTYLYLFHSSWTDSIKVCLPGVWVSTSLSLFLALYVASTLTLSYSSQTLFSNISEPWNKSEKKINVIQYSEVSPVISSGRMDQGALLSPLLWAIIRATVLREKGVSSILQTLKAFFHGNIDTCKVIRWRQLQ